MFFAKQGDKMCQSNVFSTDLYFFGCDLETVTNTVNEIDALDGGADLSVKKLGYIIIVTVSANTEDAQNKTAELLKRSRAGAHIAPEGITTQSEAAVHYLKKRSLTLSLAESCTGGMCASRIVDVSGASEVFVGSCVCYANSAKTSLLKVREKTLALHGAVSKYTASEMARGARKAFSSDIAISVTGIAGPGGGSEEKPVGTVYFGCSSKRGECVVRAQFQDKGRDHIRNKSVEFMLYTLLRHII